MRRAASQVLAHSLWFRCRPYSAYSYSSFPSRIGYYCGILSISSCPFVSGQGSSLLKVSADCRARVAEELGFQRKDNCGCKRVRASAVACMSGIAMDSNVHKTSPEDVLHFWFKDADLTTYQFPVEFWYMAGEAVDKEVKEKFTECLELAGSGKIDHWQSNPQGCLALVIVLDQFSRNIFRDTPHSFAQDQAALKITLDTIKQGWDKKLSAVERIFLYMPLMHSESLEAHEVSEQMFRGLADDYQDVPQLHKLLTNSLNFERAHHAVLKRFGRYPSRNAVLGRRNTPEEEEYLASGKIWSTPEN
ncbi:unnamed protein product [Sphagnum compactum]